MFQYGQAVRLLEYPAIGLAVVEHIVHQGEGAASHKAAQVSDFGS